MNYNARHHPRKGVALSISMLKFMNSRAKFWQSMLMKPWLAQPCLLCGTTSRNGLFCVACEAALPYLIAPHCPVCAVPTAGGEVCGRCLKDPPNFQHTVACFAYTFPLDKLIKALKYGEQLVLVNSLADKLAQRVETRPDYLVPMPLHPARLRERGFNQSCELARRVAYQLNIPLLNNACQRVRDTPPQFSLSWQERDKNVRRAFACTQNLSGRSVAVVDDVMTSGASLNELALTLRNAGAIEISAWVVARTLPR